MLFTSSEIEETLGVCDRILVFHKGRIIREFARGEASKADVMHWVAGGVIQKLSVSPRLKVTIRDWRPRSRAIRALDLVSLTMRRV